MAEEEKIVAAEPAAAALSTIYVVALLFLNEDDYWDLNVAVGLDEVEISGLKRYLRELQEAGRTKKQKVLTSVAEPFTLTSKLLVRAEPYTLIAERATRPCRVESRVEENKVERENVTVDRDGNCKELEDLVLESA